MPRYDNQVAGYVTDPGPGEGWELAIGLISAWRGAGERADRAVAQKLAEVAAERGAGTVEQAVDGLVALGNMFLELYADSAGLSIERVLREAAAVPDDHGQPVALRVVPRAR